MVGYYNSLQMLQCQRQLFSSEQKFDLCNMMLEKNPNWAIAPRTRFEIASDE